jgi:hypothetical protein
VSGAAIRRYHSLNQKHIATAICHTLVSHAALMIGRLTPLSPGERASDMHYQNKMADLLRVRHNVVMYDIRDESTSAHIRQMKALPLAEVALYKLQFKGPIGVKANIEANLQSLSALKSGYGGKRKSSASRLALASNKHRNIGRNGRN